MFNLRKHFKDIFGKPQEVPIAHVKHMLGASEAERDLFKAYGISPDVMNKLVGESTYINQDRLVLYQAIERMLSNPLVASAVETYAETATNRSTVNGQVAWVETESREIKYQIEKMFDVINLEEVIYDWTWTTACYGDMFVEVNGEKGVGIINICDDLHPQAISRVDYGGKLIGFYQSPLGGLSTDTRLLPPWQYVHARLLGNKKRRSLYGESGFSEYKTITLLSPDIRRVTSKYGCGIASNAIPIYRRLKLTEDSILCARITKGLKRYIYKVAITEGTSPEAVASMIDNYVDVVKQSARNLDIDGTNPNFNAKNQSLSGSEDLIMPVWGQANNLEIEEIGGDVDIKWLADLAELRNQLACALRIPLSLLGGYQDENKGSLGSTAAERLDIRFARQARRLQSAMITMLTRLAQIHLSFVGIPPDLTTFQIKMAEVSTAEELESQKGLSEAADTVDKMVDVIIRHTGENIDKVELFNYFNKKMLKLDDLDLKKLMKAAQRIGPHTSIPKEEIKNTEPTGENPFRESKEEVYSSVHLVENSDLHALLPNCEGKDGRKTNAIWESQYANAKVTEKESK